MVQMTLIPHLRRYCRQGQIDRPLRGRVVRDKINLANIRDATAMKKVHHHVYSHLTRRLP